MTTPLATAAAASALAALLPSAVRLETTKQPAGPAPSGAVGVGVDFVGSVSAELALMLSARAETAVRAAGGAGTVGLADIMRPAFEAAAAELGSGVLGEVSERDTTALFGDPESVVFRFTGDAGEEPFAWLALRVRQSAAKGNTELSAHKLGRIHDVEMALSVVIGRTRMSVANVLGLEPGNVVDLDRSAGSPADVLLNGRLIAHGEVVVVDQDYAVRITKILDTAETVG
ncbi:MAG: flagellar motor switch protein FliN [Specibacter sp.]